MTTDPERSAAHRRRATAVRWLRKTHGWIGLWGATLGLLFGATGILLNHRAVLKIPLPQTEESTVQLALPTPAPVDAAAWAQWLQRELALDRPAARVRSEPSRTVPWGDKAVRQPAHWTAVYATPGNGVQADYWVGNGTVTVKRSDNNLYATLANLHKGVGMSVAWVLLVDTLAGSIVLLSLSGVALWLLTHRRRTVGAVLVLAGLGVTVGLAVASLS